MMNDHARQVLDPATRPCCSARPPRRWQPGSAGAVEVDAARPACTARMHCRPLARRPAGRGRGRARQADRAGGRGRPPSPRRTPGCILPGLVGSGAAVAARLPPGGGGLRLGEWLALEGEPGVGKLAVLRAVHQRHNPAGRFHVLDAAEAAEQDWLAAVRRELLDGRGSLVIRHVDQLGARRLHALAGALQETGRGGPAARCGWRSRWPTAAPARPDQAAAVLPEHGGAAAAAPPHRGPARAGAVLPGKLNQHGRLACSPEAMKLLLRSSWPGNTEQLWQVLRRVVQHRRTGAIKPRTCRPSAGR